MEQSRPVDDAVDGAPRRPVLVTGAGGLVGRSTVARLAALGAEVVATDLRTPATDKLAAAWRRLPGVRVVWCDLTDRAAVADLLTEVAPRAVVHLAAIIPPLCYARPELSRAVNVDATGHLLAAATALPRPPRFVQASSVAVYGARNPYRTRDVLTAATPMAPTDLYGELKATSEEMVRTSGLDWVMLRLGGVMTVESDSSLDVDQIHFGQLLPPDGRIQTVDVRDVAHAFAAATSADVVGEILLIGGDESHRLVQSDITHDMTEARGMAGAIPAALPGDPDDDDTWFATDWMDTARAQEALGFQHHSWPSMLAEIRRQTGLRRYAMRLAAPVVHEVLRRGFAKRGTVRPFSQAAAQ